MARPKFVQIPSHSLARFEPILGEEYGSIEAAAARARRLFAGRAIWHVSTALRGGGVAEMLRSLLPYMRGAGVDTRWVVLRERAEFFALTKRLHNNLHGAEGEGEELGGAVGHQRGRGRNRGQPLGRQHTHPGDEATERAKQLAAG